MKAWESAESFAVTPDRLPTDHQGTQANTPALATGIESTFSCVGSVRLQRHGRGPVPGSQEWTAQLKMEWVALGAPGSGDSWGTGPCACSPGGAELINSLHNLRGLQLRSQSFRSKGRHFAYLVYMGLNNTAAIHFLAGNHYPDGWTNACEDRLC